MCHTDLQVIRGMAGERVANRRRWRFTVAPLAASLLLLLSGCGGGGSNSTTNSSTGATGASGATGPKTQGGSTTTEPKQPAVRSPAKPEQAVPKVIDTALTSDHPSLACHGLVTPRYVQTAYGGEEGCAQAIEGGAASSVNVAGVYINHNAGTARATATPTGGPNDGEKLTVGLVLDHGTWKVDSVKSNAPVGP